jgi:hypothetical protein
LASKVALCVRLLVDNEQNDGTFHYMNKERENSTHRHSLIRVDFDHSTEQVLAIGRNKVWNMEDPSLDLLEQLAQVVVVEGQRADEKRVQDHPARPHVCPPPVVLFAL